MTQQKIWLNGLWHNNPALVQLLGLCPLLAVSSNVVNALSMGLATLFTLILSNVSISLLKNTIPHTIRIPVFMLIIASAVTVVELLLEAYFYQIYLSLGIFIPLIVTNCIIIARAEGFASKQSVFLSFIDALAMGMGGLLVLVIIGAIRELLGQGSLFFNAHLLFGEWGHALTLQLNDHSFLLAILPPGAFFTTGLLIAIKNYLDAKFKAKPKVAIERIRITTV